MWEANVYSNAWKIKYCSPFNMIETTSEFSDKKHLLSLESLFLFIYLFLFFRDGHQLLLLLSKT